MKNILIFMTVLQFIPCVFVHASGQDSEISNYLFKKIQGVYYAPIKNAMILLKINSDGTIKMTEYIKNSGAPYTINDIRIEITGPKIELSNYFGNRRGNDKYDIGLRIVDSESLLNYYISKDKVGQDQRIMFPLKADYLYLKTDSDQNLGLKFEKYTRGFQDNGMVNTVFTIP